MDPVAETWIKKLGLTPHPEGGYFREAYRSGELISSLPERYKGLRCFGTSIYFLLTGKQLSAFHRIRSDETWHFYAGCPLTLYTLDDTGDLHEYILGNSLTGGEVLQHTIPSGTWFAGKPADENSYSLLGCTVAPGFEFEDFELGNYEKLAGIFPAHKKILKEFCIR